jgi:hypothetical protein
MNELTELEKLRAAREVLRSWQDGPAGGPNLATYLENEIARLEDPHAEAKERMKRWESADPTFAIVERQVLAYVRHLESELAKAKAAAEPLDPKRVYKTACELMWGDTRRVIEGHENAEPYEVTH